MNDLLSYFPVLVGWVGLFFRWVVAEAERRLNQRKEPTRLVENMHMEQEAVWDCGEC